MATQAEQMAAFRRGERVRNRQSLHPERLPKDCNHWRGFRTIVCSEDSDVVECPICGEQQEMRCNFDDDFD